jgi:predicted transcriptional regulator
MLMSVMEHDDSKEFITQAQYKQLLENDQNEVQNPKPVVMLHIPNTSNIWLLTSVFQTDIDVAYGLVLEKGTAPEKKCIWLHDLFSNYEKGMSVVREPNFKPNFPICFYKEFAEKFGSIPTKLLTSSVPEAVNVKSISKAQKVFLTEKINTL